MSRLDDIKGARHCDLFCDMPKGALGPAPVTAVSLVSFQGKTNAVRYMCDSGWQWVRFRTHHHQHVSVQASSRPDCTRRPTRPGMQLASAT